MADEEDVKGGADRTETQGTVGHQKLESKTVTGQVITHTIVKPSEDGGDCDSPR